MESHGFRPLQERKGEKKRERGQITLKGISGRKFLLRNNSQFCPNAPLIPFYFV